MLLNNLLFKEKIKIDIENIWTQMTMKILLIKIWIHLRDYSLKYMYVSNRNIKDP